MLPCKTKKRIITNLKSINNQKCQEIKLHGTLTTKELKKKSTRTTRPIRQQNTGRLRKTTTMQQAALGAGLGAELGGLCRRG